MSRLTFNQNRVFMEPHLPEIPLRRGGGIKRKFIFEPVKLAFSKKKSTAHELFSQGLFKK